MQGEEDAGFDWRDKLLLEVAVLYGFPMGNAVVGMGGKDCERLPGRDQVLQEVGLSLDDYVVADLGVLVEEAIEIALGVQDDLEALVEFALEREFQEEEHYGSEDVVDKDERLLEGVLAQKRQDLADCKDEVVHEEGPGVLEEGLELGGIFVEKDEELERLFEPAFGQVLVAEFAQPVLHVLPMLYI